MSYQQRCTRPSKDSDSIEISNLFEFVQLLLSGFRDDMLKWKLPGIELDHLGEKYAIQACVKAGLIFNIVVLLYLNAIQYFIDQLDPGVLV